MASSFISPNDARLVHAIAPGSDAVEIHYVRKGKGAPVVLLHAWPGFWYDWRAVIPKLSTIADVIAADSRGFGHSGHPAGAPADIYAPDNRANDIIALMDHLALDRAPKASIAD
jgi:pimeloyl-ACP methyl ester carboxylesterase